MTPLCILAFEGGLYRNRAAKLIEQMEKDGIAGPANHVGSGHAARRGEPRNDADSDNPILNSPFAEPTRHWELDDTGRFGRWGFLRVDGPYGVAEAIRQRVAAA